MDRESKLGIVFTVIIYLVFTAIVIVMLNIETENFLETLSLIIGFLIVIAIIEYLSQQMNWDNRLRFTIVWSLIAKEILICFVLSTISFLIITTLLMYILNDDTISKGIFNFMVSFTFVATLLFYRLYVKLNIPEMIE